MSMSWKRVLWGGAVLSLVLTFGFLAPSHPGADMVLAETPTLEVGRAADGALLIRDVTRGGADSTVTVVRDATSGGLLISAPQCELRSAIGDLRRDGALHVAATPGLLRVELGAGDDTLVADLAGGELAQDVDYAGGEGFDTVDVRANQADVSHTGLSPNDGIITAGAMRIEYRELEPVVISSVANLAINLGAGFGQTIVISDGAAAGDGQTLLTATATESVAWSDIGTVTVNCGPENNDISIIDVDSATTMTSLQINGQAGDDSLSIDFNGNVPAWLAAASLAFDGGANTAAGDSLVVSGGSFTEVVYSAANANEGTIDLDGRTITYTGLEPIIDAIPAATKTFNFSAASESIVLNAGTTLFDSFNFIDSTAGESIEFTSPTATLNVNCGAGDDTLIVSRLEGGPPVPYAVQLDGEGDTDSLIYASFCAATINPTTIVEIGVMTVGYTNFEDVTTDPTAFAECSVTRPLLWMPRGGLMPVGFTATGSGACDGLVQVKVYSNEPELPLAPDAVFVGGVLRLRAQRDWPGGTGRVYLIVAGQGADCCTVVVPTMPTGRGLAQVFGAAGAAEAACRANPGAPPPGFTQILQFALPGLSESE